MSWNRCWRRCAKVVQRKRRAASVRQLAAVLDIQYRALPDGDFNHTSVLILLDGQGRIVARSEKMDGVDAEFVAAAKKLLATQ